MLNRVVIMGRLTADPELRQTANGIATCSFTVACERSFAPKGQERQSDFISVVAWRQTAEFVSRYFSKGRMIAIEGALQTRTYDDKRHPEVRHYVTEVVADQVHFTGERANDNSGQGGYAPQGQYQQNPRQNDNGYSQQQAPMQQAAPVSFGGSIDDFEEVIGDGDLPF